MTLIIDATDSTSLARLNRLCLSLHTLNISCTVKSAAGPNKDHWHKAENYRPALSKDRDIATICSCDPYNGGAANAGSVHSGCPLL